MSINSDSGINFNLDLTKNSKEKENRDIQNIIDQVLDNAGNVSGLNISNINNSNSYINDSSIWKQNNSVSSTNDNKFKEN